eukprot:TRINITY_DN8760_c0_g1_i1.p2 TRINITY_DN8760_c0_g1~~TRINITY_DN8760_c0_g1_i1.p2  ORF type:complete len:121 (-),score=24.05 TRINITY_DN8760_c0_g1_i1:82-444(-)
MLEMYSYLNPNLSDVIDVLRLWQKALEDCFVYLGKLETVLVGYLRLEEEILSMFNIEVEANKCVEKVVFKPKTMVSDLVFAIDLKNLNLKQTQDTATALFLLYDKEEVTCTERDSSALFC